MKPKILVLDGLRQDAISDLLNRCEVTLPERAQATDRQWVLDHIGKYDGVISAKMKFDQEMLTAAKNLKIISTYAVGFDHVDLTAAKKQDIVVANCPQSVLWPTAELDLTLLLACARRLRMLDHNLRAGKWLNGDLLENQGYDVHGRTLGILGMGRIGSQVARFGKMLGMNIIYHNRHHAKAEAEVGAKLVDLDTLLAESDFLSLNAPATPATTGIINAAALKRMKKTAILINVGRGALVDEQALVKALQTGEIAGAGLDVFEHEPQVSEALKQMDNVVLTPHIGSATRQARYNLAQEAAKNITSYLLDGKVLNQVN
jgi:lactate dehydrogenase-like 2-hydroxyacid dehydrogenase